MSCDMQAKEGGQTDPFTAACFSPHRNRIAPWHNRAETTMFRVSYGEAPENVGIGWGSGVCSQDRESKSAPAPVAKIANVN
mmetsp:Transcript_20372/g.31821  ORF Transcript_20372/g.31821 Transcript_20372/m.31821 type:complete len:81 (+) Transcript_20372:1499-1741(+)